MVLPRRALAGSPLASKASRRALLVTSSVIGTCLLVAALRRTLLLVKRLLSVEVTLLRLVCQVRCSVM
jgi:hypothetical protein